MAIPLVDDELRLIVPRGHRLAGKRDSETARQRDREGKQRGDADKGFRWKDLDGESMVGFEAGSAVREVIDRASTAAGVRLDVVMELRTIEGIARQMGLTVE